MIENYILKKGLKTLTPLMCLFSAQMKQPVMFDSYKNCLEWYVLYMHNRYISVFSLISTMAYYKLYDRLRQAELLSKYSHKDIIKQSK